MEKTQDKTIDLDKLFGIKNSDFGLSQDDEKWLQEELPVENPKQNPEYKVKVKGNKGCMVTNVSYDKNKYVSDIKIPTKRQATKEAIAFYLAQKLDDLESLPYYEKLVDERRVDFLRNCLVITLIAHRQDKISTTKAKYFTGVVKEKTALQERVKRYKQKHIT